MLFRKLLFNVILYTGLLICFFSANVKVYSADASVLTPDFLSSGEWILEEGFDDCRFTAEFRSEGSFSMKRQDCGMQDKSSFDIAGKFKISGNKAVFTIDKDNGSDPVYKKGYKFEATLERSDSLKYKWYLDFKNSDIGKVNNVISLLKEGEPVSIGGITAAATGEKTVRVTAPLKMRVAPDTSAEEAEYGGKCVKRSDGKGSTYVPVKSYEKGTKLKVYARTMEKSKAGKYNNYWYYVKYPDQDCDDGEITERSGWVFGEFIVNE